MSVEIWKGDGPHRLSLTQYWCGTDRGICVQLTGESCDKKIGHVGLTVEEAAELAAQLTLWIHSRSESEEMESTNPISAFPTVGTDGRRLERVMVDVNMSAVAPLRAKDQYGIVPDVAFLRSDGWTLGAPNRLEAVAYSVWRDRWTHFARKPRWNWVPIENYSGRSV